MTKKLTILCATLSFMVLFMAVGFASLSDSLHITGVADVNAPKGLYVTSMEVHSQSYLDVEQHSFAPYSTTIDTTLSKATPGLAGSVTYKITVLNNTDKEYAYRALYYQENLDKYNNGLVVELEEDENTLAPNKISVKMDFPNGRVVQPTEMLTFYATYTLGTDENVIKASASQKNLLNYQFGINVESEVAAREAVYEKFLNILNTSITYEELVDKIDDKFDGAQEWTSNYIGNVSDAVDADSMTVETLFAGQLNMVINGQTRPATVLIKHENLDNNTLTGDSYSVKYNNQRNPTTYKGCEMTLYLTTDPLSTPNGQAPVYVTVFTCEADSNGNVLGKWYKIGDSYVGKAPIVGYHGEGGGTGSFVTDNWKADRVTYSPTSNYSYTVSQGTTIKTLTQTVDNSARTAFQTLLTRAKAMIDDLTYAGTGITIVEDAYEAAGHLYTVDRRGRPTAKNNLTRAQLIPHMISLDYALTEAQKAIDALK